MNGISGGFITSGWMPAKRLENGRMFTLQTERVAAVGLGDLLVNEGVSPSGQVTARFLEAKEGRAIVVSIPTDRQVAIVTAVGTN